MDFELVAQTEAGCRAVATIERHAHDIQAVAIACDRDARFASQAMDLLRESGVLKATLPEQYGGLGLTSIHDFAVCMSRLGRADGSVGLATTMHLFRVWTLARSWRLATQSGDVGLAASNDKWLRRVASGDVISAVVSEPGTDTLHPAMQAVREAGGWRLNGRKIFATGCPGAQWLGISCRYTDADGRARTGRAYVPADAPGVEIANNWDAMGMRASGSHDVLFRDCFVADEFFGDTGAWGEFSHGYLIGNIVAVQGLAAVFLGIAEAAAQRVLAFGSRRKTAASPPLAEDASFLRIVAENTIALTACRAVVERTSMSADSMFTGHARLELDQLHQQMRHTQCAKWLVTRGSIDVVDRSLTASGGSGYMNSSLLSKLYRDVRAGPFMQPFSPNEALDYIGRITLGVQPRAA